MNCEICGKETSHTTTVSIDNSEIEVCESCKSYGKEIFSGDKSDSSQKEILQRIKDKKRTGQTTGLDKGDKKELALDYSERIERGRIEKDFTQEELAKKLNEKKSVIAKLERSDMRPSDDLRNKLENTLNIELMEKIESTSTKRSEGSDGLTIGDLIEEKS
ncbi:MAG: multiprotein bridging factor aMBF1 [Candidatus Thermoplasmatota archaeon]